MQTFFAPYLYIPAGLTEVPFYTQAFGAAVLRRLDNADGTIHVVELSIDGNLFHLHEERIAANQLSPARLGGFSSMIGLFVPDADSVMEQAEKAGAEILQPAQSFDYGYRQGVLKDPYGHIWHIEQKI